MQVFSKSFSLENYQSSSFPSLANYAQDHNTSRPIVPYFEIVLRTCVPAMQVLKLCRCLPSLYTVSWSHSTEKKAVYTLKRMASN